MYIAQIIPVILMAPFLRYVRESPYYLVQARKFRALSKVLRKMVESNTKKNMVCLTRWSKKKDSKNLISRLNTLLRPITRFIRLFFCLKEMRIFRISGRGCLMNCRAMRVFWYTILILRSKESDRRRPKAILIFHPNLRIRVLWGLIGPSSTLVRDSRDYSQNIRDLEVMEVWVDLIDSKFHFFNQFTN